MKINLSISKLTYLSILYYSWKFAYTVILNEQARPHLAYYKWENIKINLERCREYRNIHMKQLIHQTNASDERRAIVRLN